MVSIGPNKGIMIYFNKNHIIIVYVKIKKKAYAVFKAREQYLFICVVE